MKPFQFLLTFTSGQRKGIVALFILVIVFQAGYFILASSDLSTKKAQSEDEKEWLALQPEIDALKAKHGVRKETIYPFNPNFITDYKGYTLGMSVAEIDRLHAFRKTGKYVNSAEEFRKVTGISKVLLNKISPYFKFPDWVVEKQAKQQQSQKGGSYTDHKDKTEATRATGTKKVKALDINMALEEDLVKVYGIGPYSAKKILRCRAELGAFVSMDQMDDFTDFSPEAIAGLKKGFFTGARPDVSSINVNTASLQQLSRFPYFNKSLAKAIITKRSMDGKISGIDELSKINEFPVDKIKIIALYLEF
jgi:DNA uptake protein ComE-like DNA-binding protein